MKVNYNNTPVKEAFVGDFILSTSGRLYQLVNGIRGYALTKPETGWASPFYATKEGVIESELQGIDRIIPSSEVELIVGGNN